MEKNNFEQVQEENMKKIVALAKCRFKSDDVIHVTYTGSCNKKIAEETQR